MINTESDAIHGRITALVISIRSQHDNVKCIAHILKAHSRV